MIPTQDQVRRVANLSRLYLTDEEVVMYQWQLAKIFWLFDKLEEVDVSDIWNPVHATQKNMVLRKDEVSMTEDPEKLLSVTKQEIIGWHIALPSIMRHKN